MWEIEFGKILSRIIARKDSEVFRDPVRYDLLGIPDYPLIVKEPMDLGTIKKRLDGNVYKSFEDAAYDMRLVWSNAMLYNLPGKHSPTIIDSGSKIYLLAKGLSEYFESQWIIHFPDDLGRAATNEEMSSWVDLCHRISSEDLSTVLRMLDEEYPNCLTKKIDNNEVELNVDLIPGKLFRKVQEWTQNRLPIDIVSLRRKSNIVTVQPTSTSMTSSSSSNSNSSSHPPLPKSSKSNISATTTNKTGSSSSTSSGDKKKINTKPSAAGSGVSGASSSVPIIKKMKTSSNTLTTTSTGDNSHKHSDHHTSSPRLNPVTNGTMNNSGTNNISNYQPIKKRTSTQQ